METLFFARRKEICRVKFKHQPFLFRNQYNCMNKSKRILLIDDEEVILFGFEKVLKEPGVELDCAQTMAEVRNCIAAHQYDAAIVDLRLSNSTEMEGFDCIQLLRNSQDECRIFVLTAYGDNIIRDKAEALGVDMFLEKPIEPEIIRKTLKTFGIYNN
jgi:DNA-binding response OmpR family regulator